ncbi:MAG: 3'-5' exonuclease [Gallionella sp.]|nr:3'-5' exonuclease [Gallionella sp.]
MNKPVPTKEEIALLPPFSGLDLARIHVPTSREEFAAAAAEIGAAGIVGFDTESKPTFAVGELSEGPHLVQFALHDKAYLFQMHRTEGHPFLVELLRSEHVLKVGFGLRSDSKHIRAKLGVELGGTVDLNAVFSADGYHKEMGVRAAVGLVLNRRFAKSRKVTTSNWSQPELTPQQLLYAANDAYAALKVLEALNLPREALPVMGATPPCENDDKTIPLTSDRIAMTQDFSNRMNGTFHGMLQWADLDALWARVRTEPEGWYISLAGIEPSQQTMTVAALDTFLGEVDSLLRRDHEYHYCGIVYADDPERPALIKIYDPHNLGSSCGSGGVRIPPRWVLSRMPPTLIVDEAPLPNSRLRWWQKIFG